MRTHQGKRRPRDYSCIVILKSWRRSIYSFKYTPTPPASLKLALTLTHTSTLKLEPLKVPGVLMVQSRRR